MASPLVFFQIAAENPSRTHAFLSDLFDWPSPDEEGVGPLGIQPGGPADFDVNGLVLPAGEAAQPITLFFRVPDLWATIDKAEALGATTVTPITQLPVGVHMAMIQTPDDGLTLGIVQA